MTLRAKVLLLALSSVCFINIVSTVLTAAHSIVKKREDLVAGASMIAAIQAQGLVSPLWNFNYPAAREMLQGLTLNPDFANATVLDPAGRVLANAALPENVAAGTLSGDSPIIWEANGRRQILGSVHIQLTTRSLWEYGQQQASAMLVALILTCGAVTMAILLAFRMIGQPLGRIAAVTEMLGRGRHDLEVPEQDRDDEIGHIARAVELSRRQLATIEGLRREQSHYLKVVFANAANGILEADSNGRIETVNPGAERIFGLPAHALIGMRLNRLMPGLDIASRDVAEIDTLRSGGDPLTLSVSCSDFEMAGVPKVSVIAHDITERKMAENALVAARRTAEEANRTKSAFLANMSHEIRTPMNAIIGLTRLVLGSELADRQRGHLGKVLTSAHGLLGIINDILDLSKIEAGKLTIEATEFRLDDLFEELADLNGLRAREKRLELIFDLPAPFPLTLIGDPVRLRQVLVNLIGNAIKFTEQGDVLVSVAMESVGEHAVVLRFSVRDTGFGMESEQLERIFDAFSQADVSTTRKFGGTGLGLAISRNLVSLMGGAIGVESTPGVGSRFWFTARFGLETELAESSLNLSNLPHGLRVLAVEANLSAREVLGSILASFQYSFHLAGSAAEALAAQQDALARGQAFSLALVGEVLPDANGAAAIQRLKRGQKSLASVLMAAPDSADAIHLDCSEGGIDGFLVKPVTPSRLLDTILTVLSPKGGARQRAAAQAAAPPLDLTGMRLLLVEDNEINRELAIEVLKPTNAQIEVAENGAEAIARIEQETFDGILMDCQMPVMDGYTATQRLREQPRFRSLPIIAMTANAMIGDREKCLTAGMDDYVTKPFEEAELIDVLRRWIRPHGETVAIPPPRAEAGSPAREPGDGLDRLTQLDVERGLVQSSGNRALYSRLLRHFARDFRTFDSQLMDALTSQDDTSAIRLVHTVKGLAGSIGATDLRRSAADLEANLHQGANQGILRRAIPAVIADISRVVCDIDACLPAVSPVIPPPDDGNAPPIVPASALVELSRRLAAADVNARDELAAIFARWPHLQVSMAAIGEYIDRYRFDDALAAVQEFTETLNQSPVCHGRT